MTQSVQNLLTHIHAMNREYEKVAALTGENFNIFRILKVESSEVYTHSAVLSELLNPLGSHGCKDAFLKMFLNLQRQKHKDQKILDRFESFDCANATVSIESHIGFKNEDETEGGRIDILLKDKTGNAVIVENKIYAKDQNKQLVRYNNAYKKAPILYLTLYGNQPCEESKGGLKDGVDYSCISYKDDIIIWLEYCRKEAAVHSILRETITQYINLIKYLTHQTMNENMKDEMIELILKSKENIESAKTVHDNWEKVELAIIQRLRDKIKDVAVKLKLKITFECSDENPLGKDGTGFWFYKTGWKHCIYFYFDGKEYDLLVGIDNIDNSDKCDEQLFRSALADFVIRERIRGYGNWLWVERFRDWSDTAWSEILTKTPNDIEECCRKILNKLRELRLD